MELRQEIRQRLRSARSWPSLIEELEKEAEQIQAKDQKARRLYELGELCEDLFLRKDRAMIHYQAAFKLSPQDARALERAREIYREMGNLEMVAKLLELEWKVTGDAARKSAVEGKWGIALLDLGRRDAALPHLEAAEGAQPDSREISDALAAANYDREDWEGEVERLRKQVEHVAQKNDAALAARIWLRIARIHRLQNVVDGPYIEALQKVVAAEPQHEHANFLLELALAAQKRHDDIFALHNARLDAAADGRQRAELARKFASVWALRLADVERAASFYRRALEAYYADGVKGGAQFPGHLAAFSFLREIAGQSSANGGGEQWPKLLAIADLGMRAELSDDEIAILATQAALISWKEVKDEAKARGYFDRVQRVFPESEDLHAFMRAVGGGVDSAPSAAAKANALLAAVAGGAPTNAPARPAEPAKAEAQAAPEKPVEKTAEKAGEPAPAKAEEAPRAAAEPAKPAEPAKVEEPAKSAQSAKPAEPAKSDPAAAPAARVETIDDAVKAQMDAARALEGQVDKAIEAWKKIIAAHPTLRAPRRALAALYRKAERWNAFIDLLKDEVEKLPDTTPDEKVELLFEMVTVYKERLKLDVMVINAYNAILAIRPTELKALDALAAQYEQMKRWPDLISTLQKRAAAVADAHEQVELYLRIAGLFQEKFSNVAEAIKAYEKALELDPANSTAIAYLKTNYEKRRDWEKLIAVNQREIDRVADPVERGRRFIEVAKLASEKLKKPSVSIELWEKVLGADPEHLEALGELEKLYEREKVWDKLADVCETQARLFSDKAKRVAMLQKLGILFTDKVNEPERATAAWKSLLELEPENKRAQDALKKLYLSQRRYDELEQFYAQQNKYDEYIRVLERQVESPEVDSPAAKVALQIKIAELYRDRLQKPDRARAAYEKVLALDGENLNAAEALIPLYEQAKDPRKLVGVLEIQLRHTPAGDVATRVARMRHLGELSEQALKDKAAAFGWYLRVVGEDPATEWVRPEVERLAKETGGFTELVGAYEAAAGKLAGAEKLPLLSVVARVYEEELAQHDRALATNNAIVELDENNPAAIAALERLYLLTERYQDLLGIYDKKLRLTTDGEAQKEIRYKVASIFENEIKDTNKAIQAYQDILADHGEELQAYRALDRIYQGTSQWKQLAEIIHRELNLVPPGDTAATVELKFRLGQLLEQHLDDPKGAIAQYKDILDLEPSHGGARQALERRLADADHQLTAAAILEPIYAHLEDWGRLIEVHEIQLAREKDPLNRVRLLLRIGELQATKIGDGEKAFDAYARCFREDPSNETARQELERLAVINESWPELVKLYEAAIETPVGKPGSAQESVVLMRELLLAVAVAYDERLEKPERAVEYFRRAQSIEPDDTTALEALEKLYTRNERWNELVDVYKKKVELTHDPTAREQIYFRLAALWEEMLGNVDEAIATYKEVLSQDSANVRALKALDRLFQGQKQWHALADNLTRQLQLTPDDDQQETIGLLVRLAALRERELGEVAAAVDTYRQVLDLDASNPEATAALERLIGLPEHELSVATILEPIYKQRNEWARLVDVYEIMVRHSMDPARKIELLHQIGELYEVGGDDGDRAFATYDRALREEPGLKETQTRLERLARVLDRWKDLVKLYQAVVEQVAKSGTGDPELQVQLLMRVAQIEETQLGDNDAAAAAYHQVLRVSPRELDAANALEAIYLRTDAYTKLVEVVLLKADIVEAVPEKKELCFKAAQIFEEVLENPDRAIDVYRQVLTIDEHDRAAIDALERLYIKLERWEPLKDVYSKKAELATVPDEKKQMLFVLGQVYDRELKDPARAIETYQGILDLDPEDVTAIQALDRLYQQTGRWYDLLQILEREVELASATGEIVSLKYRVGQLWERELKDFGRAIEAYREVLALDGGHEPTLAALDGLVHGEQEPVLAAQVLEPIYETAGEWERLIDVLDVMVRHAEDPVRKVELLHRIADYYERCLEDSPSAFRAYGAALKEDAQNELTLGHLERLADATRAWAELAALYESELAKMMEVPRQVEMLLRVARVYEEELAQRDKAIATFRRVVDADSENRDAILALDRLYQQAERWTDLVEILRREIRLAGDDNEIIALQFRLGQLFEQNLRDVDNAIDVYREILTADPGHGPTLAALELLFAEGTKQLEIAAILEPIYRMAEQWEKLVKIHEVQLAKLTAVDDRIQMIQRIAEIHEHKLVDQPSAFVWWAQALREAPMQELAGEETERLARACHTWEELVNVYQQILDERRAPTDREIQQTTLLKLARVFEEELRDNAKAEEAFLQVLALDPRDDRALSALDRIYAQASMWSELADILTRRIGVITDTDELIELHFRLGRVYADALDEPDKAVQALSAILETDSRNKRALEALEQVYFRGQRWADLFSVYEKMVDIAPGDDGMADCYARMAKIASDGLNDRQRAVDLWGRVLDLRGEDPMALGALADLHEQAGEWRELVDILGRVVRITQVPAEQIPIWSRLGRIYLEKLNKERDALDAWQKVLEIDPSDIPALRALAGIYKSTQAWEELVETLHRLIEVGTAGDMSADELVELYAELGQVQGEILMRPHEAIDAWQRVLALDERDFRALNALETLFTQEARWEECIQTLERKAKVLEDDRQKVDVLLQAAAVWEDKIGDRDNAGLVYERILQIDSVNMTASVQLEQVYRAQQAWDKLIELLLARVEFTTETAQRVATFQAVAEIYEKEVGDQEGAFVVLQAAFRENYADIAVSSELERLATASNKWTELLQEYTQVVQTIPDPKTAADLWVKIGRWYGQHLGQLEYAIWSEQQALALDPDHTEALENLAGFYRKSSKWPELSSTLARHADLEEDPAKKVQILLDLAELYAGPLGDEEQAIQSYQRALEVPVDGGATLKALDALEKLYRRREEWPSLIEVLSKKAAIVEDNDEIVRLRGMIGRLYEERLGDGAKAIASFQSILTIDPQSVDALKALERLYEKTGNMEAYLDVLEQQLDVSGSDEERISLYERMAAAWEEQFRRPDRAWEALEKILLINDRHEPTLMSLERLYRQERRSTELVETLRRHINAVNDPAVRVQLYAQMGQVFEEDLKDVDRAIESFNDILSFDSDNTHALAALVRLYERIEDWHRAIETATRLIEITDAPQTRVELNHRIGRIYEERLKEPETAEAYYVEALSLNPAFVPAMHALTQIYQKRGDWLKAAQMMVRAEEQTTNPLEKARLLYEAGRIYREKLENELNASELFARVLELDPEHVEAGEPLAEIYFRDEQWRKLEPIVEMLVRKADKKDNKELNQLYYRVARTADELGNPDKALKYYKLAYDLDSTFLPTLLGRAALLYKLEDWEGAFKIYQTILVHHRDSQKESEIVEIFYRLGNIKLKQGERKKALNMFEKALEINSAHRPTLLAVIDLQQQAADWEAVIHAKRALLAVAEEPERVKLLDEIGDTYHQKLQNHQKAIGAYLEALEVRPGNHVILHKVLDLYSETKQWKKAVEIISQIADLEKDPVRKGKYYHAAARILRDEVKSLDEAVEAFNQALDCYFERPERIDEAKFQEYLKAFEAIDKICTQKKDWMMQSRQYRRMIKRMPPTGFDTIRIALWHALGEIYRSRLKDIKTAIQAFEVAVNLEPDNLARHEILAELYVVGGSDYSQQAVKEHMTLIRKDPFRVESYKALRRLYMDLRQYDRAWCMCSALAFLQRADGEEMQFYEQYKQKGFVRAKTRLSEEMWVKNVYHPDEDPYIGAIFASIHQAIAMRYSAEHKQFGLKRKEKRDLTTDQTLFAKVFNYVTQVLSIAPPEVYFRPEQAISMQLANAREKNQLIPSVVVGAELLQGRSDKELAFPVARYMTMLRPEHFLRLIIQTNTELRVAFLSAVKRVQPNFPVPANEAQTVELYLQEMSKTLLPAAYEQLAIWVQRFLQKQPKIDLAKWSQAVDLTAHRAGFIVSNDLALAARYIQMEPATAGGMSAKDKIKELVLYSISEEYFELREHLGLTIG
jgi:tetratricopeptide (TPR) repeat protein